MAKKEKTEKKHFNLENWEVANVRKLDFGTFFTLKVDGLALYNLRVVPEGKNYNSFIAMPQDKGNDGNYYNRFSLYLSEDDTEEIIEEVEKQAKESTKSKKSK